jgi:hypothetical protein
LRCEHCFSTTGRELNHPTVECNKLKRKILEDAQTQTTSRRDTANIATATITNPRIDFGYPAFLGNANHRDASVWIADCGAKKNTWPTKSPFSTTMWASIGSWIIEGIRVATATVHGYGDVIFEAKIGETLRTGLVRKVLFVPDIGVNLISIGTVTALGAKSCLLCMWCFLQQKWRRQYHWETNRRRRIQTQLKSQANGNRPRSHLKGCRSSTQCMTHAIRTREQQNYSENGKTSIDWWTHNLQSRHLMHLRVLLLW